MSGEPDLPQPSAQVPLTYALPEKAIPDARQGLPGLPGIDDPPVSFSGVVVRPVDAPRLVVQRGHPDLPRSKPLHVAPDHPEAIAAVRDVVHDQDLQPVNLRVQGI